MEYKKWSKPDFRSFRGKHSLRQKDLATLIGLRQNATISRWENYPERMERYHHFAMSHLEHLIETGQVDLDKELGRK